jgi:hypothetical protein
LAFKKASHIKSTRKAYSFRFYGLIIATAMMPLSWSCTLWGYQASNGALLKDQRPQKDFSASLYRMEAEILELVENLKRIQIEPESELRQKLLTDYLQDLSSHMELTERSLEHMEDQAPNPITKRKRNTLNHPFNRR